MRARKDWPFDSIWVPEPSHPWSQSSLCSSWFCEISKCSESDYPSVGNAGILTQKLEQGVRDRPEMWHCLSPCRKGHSGGVRIIHWKAGILGIWKWNTWVKLLPTIVSRYLTILCFRPSPYYPKIENFMDLVEKHEDTRVRAGQARYPRVIPNTSTPVQSPRPCLTRVISLPILGARWDEGSSPLFHFSKRQRPREMMLI